MLYLQKIFLLGEIILELSFIFPNKFLFIPNLLSCHYTINISLSNQNSFYKLNI